MSRGSHPYSCILEDFKRVEIVVEDINPYYIMYASVDTHFIVVRNLANKSVHAAFKYWFLAMKYCTIHDYLILKTSTMNSMNVSM